MLIGIAEVLKNNKNSSIQDNVKICENIDYDIKL